MRRPSLLKRLWLNSQTKLVAYCQAASGSILLSISTLDGWFNNPTVKGYLSQMTVPHSISIGLLAIAIITYIAHGHGDNA